MIKRFDPHPCAADAGEMFESERGEWVSFKEYEILRQRIEDADAILTQLEDTAKGYQGDLVTEARIALNHGVV